MATHTIDELFAAHSRQFKAQFMFYFTDEPLVVNQDNYLIDFEIDEAIMSGNDVLGAPQPSTLDISLLNTKGMFTPSNEAGPYAGLIAPGVKIVGELKVIALGEESDWLPLGTYFVTDWKAPSGSAEASVYASDCLQSILDANPAAVEVTENMTYSQFISYFFEKIGSPAVMEDTLGTVLPFGWSSGDSESDIKDLTNAARAVCISNRTAAPHIFSLVKTRNIRLSIDDNSGLFIKASENSSFVQQYGGVELTYRQPSLLTDADVLTSNGIEAPSGESTLDPIAFNKTPVYAVESVGCQTERGQIVILNYQYTPSEITVSLRNSDPKPFSTELAVRGTVVDFTDAVLTDKKDDLFSFSSDFIQSSVYAGVFKAFLNRYVSSKLPTITLETTGNIGIKLLDRIKFSSAKYSMQFDGVVTQIHTKFSSGLTQTFVLMNSSILTDQ